MEISNKFKPIMKLVSLLAPNYIFSPRTCVGISNQASYIDIHYIPDPNDEYWVYVGYLRLNLIKVIPNKPTEVILCIPYSVKATKDLRRDWKNIGIYFKACKYDPESYYRYYIIGINDADSTK